MASKITPQSGLLEVDGRLKVKDAIYANEVLTKGAVSKSTERQVLAAELIDTTSGVIPIVVAINTASAYDVTTELPKVKIFDDATNDKIIGVATTTILNAASGFAVNYGPITSNLNTSASTVNAAVYADPANGELTLTNTGKQVGTVLTLHASAGEVLINVAGEAGAGSGGDTNFITDSNPESGQAANYATYDDGASATPINGTGGAASTLTFAAYTASPLLRTLGDWKLTKTAANGQGEGLAYDFAIEPAFKNQVMEVSYNYNTSANYVSNDMGMYIYDVTNSVIIYPNVINIPQTSNTNAKMYFKFFATSGVDYRVIFHVQTTSALAYTFSFTDFSVRPETKVIGAAISDWISYTPTIQGITVNSSQFYQRRVGSNLEVFGNATLTAAAATQFSISLPTGLSADTTKLTSKVSILGTARRIVAGNSAVTSDGYQMDVYWSSAVGNTLVTMAFTTNGGLTGTYVDYNGNNLFTSNETFNIIFSIPIANWSSNINLIQSQTEFAYNTDTTDTDNTTSFGYGAEGNVFGVYAPATDTARKKRVRFQQPIQITDKIEIEVWNGQGWQGLPMVGVSTDNTRIDTWGIPSPTVNSVFYGMGTKIINSTDIEVWFGTNASDAFGNATTWTEIVASSFKWRVRKSAGSAVGEVAPFVGAKYKLVVAANSSTTLPVQWATKDYDTHNAVTTGSAWKFTAPVAGYYSVKIIAATSSANQNFALYKNGIVDTNVARADSVGFIVGSSDIKLEQGDYIDVRNITSTDAIAINTVSNISIAKIG